MGFRKAERVVIHSQYRLLTDFEGGMAYYSCSLCYQTIEAASPLWGKPNLIAEHLLGHMDYAHGVTLDDLMLWAGVATEDVGGETAR